MSEITHIKNNSKSYLRNIYNTLFYDKKTQVDFRGIFFEKVFNVDSSINDFIEMSLKILLEYHDNTDDRHYVKTIYQLFDENNNSLFVKLIINNEYSYFSNRLIIDENIFL